METTNHKFYHLTGPDGKVYDSYKKGLLGKYDYYMGGDYYNDENTGHYGRLDCPAVLNAL